NQPIIKSYVEYRDNVESVSINGKDEYELELAARILDSTTKYSKKDMFDNVSYKELQRIMNSDDSNKLLYNIRKKLSRKNKDLSDNILDILTRFSTVSNSAIGRMAISEMRNQIKVKSDLELQLGMLKEFKKLITISREVTDNVLASSIDTKGKGKNITSAV